MDGLDPNQQVKHASFTCEVDDHDKLLVEIVKVKDDLRNVNFLFDTAHIVCLTAEDAKRLQKYLNESLGD